MVIFYGPKETPEAQELGQKSPEATTRVEGVPLACRCLMDPLDVRLTPKIPINPQTSENKPRSGVSPLQASESTKNQSMPVPAPCWRGESSPEDIFIIPVATMMRRE